MPLLTVSHLSKAYPGLPVLHDVSFDVAEGEIYAFLGLNGAGKTTLFNCITGYYPPTKGDVVFKGVRLNGLQPDHVCRLGMVRTWQKVRPLAKMTVLDNVMVGALVRTASLRVARAVAHEQLQVVRMDHRSDRLAGGLPIGERKKLEIARALATKPEMVLLDEVMGGLNTGEKEEIIQLILDLRKRGFTQVVIEHDMRAIMRVSDRVVVLNSGEKLTEGSPTEVANNPDVIAAYLGEKVEV